MQAAVRFIHADLAKRLEQGADSMRIADAAVVHWSAIEAALSPVIGDQGVAALLHRSIFLSRAQHPWLAETQASALVLDDFSFLRTALAQQPGATAAAGNTTLLQTFHDLLTKLIGESLTERLLRAVLDNPSNGHAVQDTSR